MSGENTATLLEQADYESISRYDDFLRIKGHLGSIELDFDGRRLEHKAGEQKPDETAYLANGLLEVLKTFKEKYGQAALEKELHSAPEILAAIEKAKKTEELEKIVA